MATEPAKIYLVRHGKAAAGFGAHRDPGLDEQGRSQAAQTAALLAPRGPLPIYTSPLARARETAAALAERWHCEPKVEPRVSELPTPSLSLPQRAEWVASAMEKRWSQLDASLGHWREELLACIGALAGDSVVFSHFIAINAVVGYARGDERVVNFRPDNASVTVCATSGGAVIEVLSLGREADTQIR